MIISEVSSVHFFIFIFALSALVQVAYYLFFYSSFFLRKRTQPSTSETEHKSISVLIAAHNEADNLKKYLPSVLEQDYNNFEVIVINDRSKDETEAVLSNFKQKYPHLRTSEIKDKGKLKHGKKLAITLAVKASKYDYLVLTDADCQACSPLWLQQMAEGFNKKPIVLAYGPYFELPSFVNKLIRYDTLSIALQYLSYSEKGFPYMGIGRNLAYKKSLFVNNGGLASHAHKRSGDDDLFINEVANKSNTTTCISPESFVYSDPELSFKSWLRQKKRHLSTFSSYKKGHNILLGTEVMSRELFYIFAISLFVFADFSKLVLLFFLLRMGLYYFVFHLSTKTFKEKRLLLLAPLFDFILPIINFFLVLKINSKYDR